MHRAKPGSGAKETNNVDTKITLDQRPRHVSGHKGFAATTSALFRANQLEPVLCSWPITAKENDDDLLSP